MLLKTFIDNMLVAVDLMYLHSFFTCIVFYLPLFYHMLSKL